MNTAFRCRLPANGNINKIHRYFSGAETIYLLAGKAGIVLKALTPGDSCMYMLRVSSCDIYQLSVRDPNDDEDDPWKHGGIYKSISASKLINFIVPKEASKDIMLEINDDATAMEVSIMTGDTVNRSVTIDLVTPDQAYEAPSMTYANVVIKVDDFRKMCSVFAKINGDIKVAYQDRAIRISAGEHVITNGNWDTDDKTNEYIVDKTPFNRITRINIGNTKNLDAGIYVKEGYPMMFKVKLGIADFIICSKVKEP